MRTRKTRFLAVVLSIALALSCCSSVFAADESNADGVVFSATLSKSEIQKNGTEQTIVMTVTTNKAVAIDSAEYDVECDDVLTPATPTSADMPAPNFMWSWNAGTKHMVGMWAEFGTNAEGVTEICQVQFTVPADIELGEYTVGISGIQLSADAEPWEEGASAFATFEVKPVPNAATKVVLNKTTLALAAGSSEQLIPTITAKNPNLPCTEEVVWSSDKETVATVDAEGNVTAVSIGTAKIKVTVGSKTATCTVTVTCPHTNTTAHEAVASTCKVQGNDAYTTCDACGVVTSGSAAKLPLDPNNHVGETYKDGAVAATCNKAGNEDNTYCSDCNKMIEAGAVIPATGEHADKDGKWDTDGTNHWYVCSCGTKFGVEAHKGGTATCKEKAVCEVCSKAYGTVNATNHVGETYEKGYKAPTCKVDGKQNSVYCADCNAMLTEGAVIPATGDHVDKDGKWNTDGVNHWYVCGCGTKFAEEAHKGGTATCVKQAECEVCAKLYGEKNAENHTGETFEKGAVTPTCKDAGKYADIYCSGCKVLLTEGAVIPATGEHVDKNGKMEFDENGHWETCGCGETFNPAAHTLENTVAKTYLKSAATCQSAAVYYKSCVCGFVSEETFTDGEPDATAHKWDKGVVTVEPTEEATGLKVYTCTVEGCGQTKEEVLPVKTSGLDVAPSNPEATEPETPVEPSKPVAAFSDIAGQWFEADVKYVFEKGLMNGVGDGSKFAPNMNTSRGMIVTILWRMEGQPVPMTANTFKDVEKGAYYEQAVAWAAEKGIVNGYGDTFGPNDNITREQFATILFRYAQYKGYDVSAGEDTNILSYADAFSVSEYAIPAMQWACGAGLINGNGDQLMPTGVASRAQAAAILHRFCENIQ